MRQRHSIVTWMHLVLERYRCLQPKKAGSSVIVNLQMKWKGEEFHVD
jgi:hypothetical protein